MKTLFILTELEGKVLTEICKQLSTWRDKEPGYSCISGSDITKALQLKPKRTSGVISSLCQKGLLYSEIEGSETSEPLLYPAWDKIPDDFAR